VNHDFFGVAAAGEESHRSIAGLPAVDVLTDIDDFSGALEAEDRRGTRRRRIESATLKEVGAIDGRRSDADPEVVGPELRCLGVTQMKHGLVAGLVEDDGFHRGFA
jgi:hypothetical protein